MLSKIKIRDFQSIAEADVPIGGLTVIVGPSDVGKSALVRAMSAAVYNRRGADCIRTGARQARVALQFDDGVVLWEREKSVRFLLRKAGQEDSEYIKVGVSVPPEITDFHRMGSIEAGDLNVKINLAGQFDPPFLLTESAPARAKLLSSITGAGFLLQMGNIASKRTRALTREIKEVRAQLEDADETVERYAVVELIWSELERVKEQAAQLDLLRQIIEALEGASVTIEGLDLRVKKLAVHLVSSDQIEKLDKLPFLRDLQSTVIGLEESQERVKVLEEAVNIEPPDPGNLEREFGLLGDIASYLDDIQDVNSKSAQLSDKMNEAEGWTVALEKEQENIGLQLGVCPLCGGNLL